MKKLFLILPLFLLSLFFVNAAGIDCNLSVPSTLGNLSVFNVTYNASITTHNVSAFVEGRSATTRNSSFSFIANNTNTSNRFHVNVTLQNEVIAEDSDDWEFRATCYLNASGSETSVTTSSTISNRLLDRHKPAPPTAITFTNPLEVDNTITATINRNLANRCFIRFGSPSTPRNAMTLSGSTCTFTVGRDNPINSDYQTFIEADDRTNSTLSNVQSVTIRAVSSDGGGLFGGGTITTGANVGG